MPGVIQRIPPGLQGFLELKGEQLPSPLSRELFAQLELRRWYLEGNAEIVVSPPQALLVGNVQYTEMQVPNTEWWHVSAVMAAIQDFTAAEVLTNIILGVLVAPAGVMTPVTLPRTLTGTAANPLINIGAQCDIFLPPGSSALVSNVEGITGAGGTIAPQARITRLAF